MSHMKKILLFLLLFITIISCRKANMTEIRPMGENITDSTKILLVEDKYPCMELVTGNAVCLNIPEEPDTKDWIIKAQRKYLPLETKEECLIGRIDKLESDGNQLFIFDESNSSVFRFSQKDGSFLNRIGNKGRGPGEYTGLADMSVDKKKKEVCLTDSRGFKLMYFNYDGNLLREEPFFYFYDKMEFIGDYLLVNTDQNRNVRVPAVNNNRFIIAKRDQTPLYVGFPYSEHLYDHFCQGIKFPFITCNEDIYYNHVLSDTIWQIKNDGICEAKYIFKFPGRDNLFNESDFQNITDEEYNNRIKNNLHYRDNVYITKDFLYARIGNMSFIYCIPTGNHLYGMPYNEFFTRRNYNTPRFTLNGTSFVYVLQPFNLIKENLEIQNSYDENAYKYYWDKQLTEEERQLLGNMTEEDNPILMIMDIEPF